MVTDTVYVNNDTPSEKYDVYKITQNGLGKTWIEMKIQKDMDLQFAWEKNGGKDTDLIFSLKRASDTDFREMESFKGSEPCIDEGWRKSEEIYQVKKGDILRWGLWVRFSSFKGKAWVAVHYPGMVLEVVSPNNPPGNPSLNKSSVNLTAGGRLCLSATSDDNDNDKIKYIFNWSDSTEDTEFFSSGAAITLCHPWNYPGTYTVRARAIDERGGESAWSEACMINIT